MAGWRFWIDRGGTFTDVVAASPGGEIRVRKVLSVQPERPGDPAVRAIGEMLGLREGTPLPADAIEEVRLGTTVATNALLERRGEPVLLLVNEGLADLLRIGDQHRPDLFALRIERPAPLHGRVLEVAGRRGVDGRVVEPLRLDAALATELARARAEGFRSCAVALMHAVREPADERRLGAWLEEQGFEPVVLSHRVSAGPRLVPRGQTAVVEASVGPVLRQYLSQVRRALGTSCLLRVMQSSGGLADPDQLLAKDTILSGPAGGMVGAVRVAERAGLGEAPIVGFDMGGTSTDVFHFDPGRGELAWERSRDTEIAGLRLEAPMLPIHTVAAGGGSVLHFDGERLQVGPRSAGADPGPACYRRGGPLTITDANLLLGRLQVDRFPAVFGPAQDQPPDPEVVRRGFEELAARMTSGSAAPTAFAPAALTVEALAEGALAIAVERMAEAIRRISIQRGHDLRGAVLVCCGGAGGQHACRLAAALGLERVLLHPLAGVLSAYGIGLAEQRLLLQESLRRPLAAPLLPELERCAARLEREARLRLGAAAEIPGSRLVVQVELRLPGSEQGLLLGWIPDPEALREAFAEAHRQRFGYRPEGPLAPVVERLLVELVVPPAAIAAAPPAPAAPAATPRSASLHLPGTGWTTVPLWQREQLRAGQRLEGPALIAEATGMVVLEPFWRAERLAGGELLLARGPAAPPPAGPSAAAGVAGSDPAAPDPVRLELYNHRFAAIAEQMGVRLQQTSQSVNIRERLDFSCALFDAAGRLVANAPHIPVHLGSMGASVASLLAAVRRGELPPLGPEDAVATNDPFAGGTHLPDITVISPVFAPGAGKPGAAPLFFVACRGHHADVGGITPGSMPPFSRRIEEEGLLLRQVSLLRNGRLDLAAWRQRLAGGPQPVRNPEQLLADLQAQLAANRLGIAELRRLLARQGVEEVRAYMAHVQANATAAVRRVVGRLRDGEHELELDDGSTIRVAVRIDRERHRVRVDFTGTSPQQEGNANAPLAITRAVVLYVFRCLVGEPIPLNDGCFEPIDLAVPPGSLLNPRPPAAVVAGNVETSQAVANALFAALGVMAAAQGTMNNLSFGDERRQYYETICGGTGAGIDLDGRGFDGADAVQSHMTNSRLTDPEILEDRFPVRLEHFGLRRGSGGAGRWRGGDGVVRVIRFLAPLTVSLLCGSRRVAPFGLAGGEPGRPGRNRLLRADGREVSLPGSAQVSVEAGDALVIETPGGGGCGAPEPA